jgi:arginine decarboxylase
MGRFRRRQSKFGLNASELLEAIQIASDNKVLDCVKLIHFHLGSQITKIRKIKNGLRECSQFYVQLKKLGCNIQFVDIGGGLGVDYDGSRTSSPSVLIILFRSMLMMLFI